AVLHLLYARFWHKVLFDLGYLSKPEPFQRLVNQGLILGEDHQKMSKSRGNVVSPDNVVREFGADVLRLYEMFMGEFELPKPWDPRAIEGLNRFVKRVWRLCDEFDAAKAPTDDPHRTVRHKTIKRVTTDLERMQFNTVIAALMEYLNAMTEGGGSTATREDLLTLVKLVGPYAPHLGDEAWERLGEKGFLLEAPWPTWDEALTIDATATLAVQVDGKVRGTVELPRDASEDVARAAALALPNVTKFLEGRRVAKLIYKPGRIIGFVTSA
ncbi:MAG: leucyl-tRNA synthetase, partial [Myxococcales bacterium]|nr:leucyl-tRNA synthetase [Myxococcales bacterium]